MEIIDNLKKIFKKENWRLATLVIWLLVGVVVIQFLPIVGIIIFLPYLTFLMFLFLLSLATRKNIMEYPAWKIVLFLIASLPLLLLLAIILIVLFAISIVSYFFFTSWFILYACYLIGIGIDNKLVKRPRSRPYLRTLMFIGGVIGSLLLLYLFILGPTIFDFSLISTEPIPDWLNFAYIVVGCVIIGLTIFGLILMFKRVFNTWLGVFFILVAGYTLFLVVKIYLGLDETSSNTAQSTWTAIGMLIVDLAIILYTLSTLMGKNAELLVKRFKHMGIDTAIIWLIFSKVSYEFIRYFPYQILVDLNIPFGGFLSSLDNDYINYIKNLAVLGFFILLLAVIGIYEIRKYSRQQRELKVEAHLEADRLISPQPTDDEEVLSVEEPQAISEESLPLSDELETTDGEDNILEKEDDFEYDDPNENQF
ncbi:MAG: hypothetical protein ACFE9S_20440 [Candidatus Hermodarchaeota archaeon]